MSQPSDLEARKYEEIEFHNRLRDAATKLVLGDPTLTGDAKIAFDNDRLDFLNAEGWVADTPADGVESIDTKAGLDKCWG